MSHIVTIRTEVRDVVAVQAACRRLQWPAAVECRVKLFSGEVTGWAVELPEWRYPLVCDLASGTLHYDNYEERWGKTAELHRFLQSYAIEKTRVECRRQGYAMTEQPLADGSVKLLVNVGGAV